MSSMLKYALLISTALIAPVLAQPTPPPPNITATSPITVTPSGASYASRVIACPTCGTGAGSVTSVGVAVPAIMSVAGSPVTTSGTITISLATQTANLIFAGPTSGGAVAPTFRAMVAADLPSSVVIGPSSATDGNFAYFDGATGKLLKNGGVPGTAATATTGTSGHTLGFLDGDNTHSGVETFGSVVGAVNSQSGTTYTLQASDCGKSVVITNGSAITLTTFQAAVVGCSITVVQGGAGQITMANGGSATLVSAHSYTKTFNGAGATIGLSVYTNAGGTAAVFTLSGDGA